MKMTYSLYKLGAADRTPICRPCTRFPQCEVVVAGRFKGEVHRKGAVTELVNGRNEGMNV